MTSTRQGFLDDFEDMHDLIEEVQRDLECQIAQISRPRFEEAWSLRSKGEHTSWGQACPETPTINSQADNFDNTAKISPTSGYIDVSIKVDVNPNISLATTLES